jgi:hypothetical protein
MATLVEAPIGGFRGGGNMVGAMRLETETPGGRTQRKTLIIGWIGKSHVVFVMLQA